jgi:hypothetical protein
MSDSTSSTIDFFKSLIPSIGTGIITKATAVKTGDAADIEAACGRKPLLNIGGKKDAYLACAANYTSTKAAASVAAANAAAAAAGANKGFSPLAITGFAIGGIAIVSGIVYLIVKKTKKSS